jgi:hypothetical protein
MDMHISIISAIITIVGAYPVSPTISPNTNAEIIQNLASTSKFVEDISHLRYAPQAHSNGRNPLNTYALLRYAARTSLFSP